MSKKKPLRKFAQVKKIIAPSDPRKKSVQEKEAKRKEVEEASKVRHVEQVSSNLYFRHNTALGPPYHVLIHGLPTPPRLGHRSRSKAKAKRGVFLFSN